MKCQTGNKNAFIHGFYFPRFKSEEKAQLTQANNVDVTQRNRAGGIFLRPYQLEPAQAILKSIINGLGLKIVVVIPQQSGKDEMFITLLPTCSRAAIEKTLRLHVQDQAGHRQLFVQ